MNIIVLLKIIAEIKGERGGLEGLGLLKEARHNRYRFGFTWGMSLTPCVYFCVCVCVCCLLNCA